MSMSPTPSRALPAGLAPASKVLQEIGRPRKIRPRKWHVSKGVPTISNSNILGRLVTMASIPTTEKVIPYALLGMTAVTGLVDAVSLLTLGHVFVANMTGNIVFLAFAAMGVPDVSVARSLTAVSAFLVGAVLGGRIMARTTPDSQFRPAVVAFAFELAFLAAATLVSVGYKAPSSANVLQSYGLIALTAFAMGTRNAAVRKLAVPDLTTTVLTLTITGLAADSSLAHGNNPRWGRRAASIMAMFAGASVGVIAIRSSVFLALALAVGVLAACGLALILSFRSASSGVSNAE